jgi:hypothetical protein
MSSESRKESIVETINMLSHEEICRLYFGTIDQNTIISEIEGMVEDMDEEELEAIEELLSDLMLTQSNSDIPDHHDEDDQDIVDYER